MLQEQLRRRRRPVKVDRPSRVIAYTRVSTEEQADSRAGVDAQRAALQVELTRRGWTDVEWIEDAGYSAKSLDRPGIQRALKALSAGEAGVLAVAKLDRLSRSLLDFANLMDRSTREGWALVANDIGVDTSSPQGEVMAAVLAAFAQFERRLIGQRTRDALAAKRAQGVRLGRRPETGRSQVRSRMAAMRAAGMTYAQIADALNARRVKTLRGGARWHPSTVQRALRS